MELLMVFFFLECRFGNYPLVLGKSETNRWKTFCYDNYVWGGHSGGVPAKVRDRWILRRWVEIWFLTGECFSSLHGKYWPSVLLWAKAVRVHRDDKFAGLDLHSLMAPRVKTWRCWWESAPMPCPKSTPTFRSEESVFLYNQLTT